MKNKTEKKTRVYRTWYTRILHYIAKRKENCVANDENKKKEENIHRKLEKGYYMAKDELWNIPLLLAFSATSSGRIFINLIPSPPPPHRTAMYDLMWKTFHFVIIFSAFFVRSFSCSVVLETKERDGGEESALHTNVQVRMYARKFFSVFSSSFFALYLPSQNWVVIAFIK